MMRATELLRGVLDLLDQIEDSQPNVDVEVKQNDEPDDRFKQILSMLDKDSFGGLANSPNEVVADVDTVTKLAGGGLNGPKDPADIRVKDPRGYE